MATPQSDPNPIARPEFATPQTGYELARLGAAPPTRVGPLEPLFPKQVPAEAAAAPGA